MNESALDHWGWVWKERILDKSRTRNNLWDYLKRRLGEYEEDPKGILALWERIEKEWNKILASVCQNLIESMPRRIQAVLKAKGGHN